MGKQTVIQDVCDVIVTDTETGHVVANTYLQVSSLDGTITEDDLRAGIGNGKIFKIRSDKDLNLSFTSAVFDSEWLAMTQGVEVTEKTALITKIEHLTVEGGEVTLEGEPVNGTIRVVGESGTEEDLDAVNGVVTVTTAQDGEAVDVSYQEEITGESIEFDSAKFSKKYKVEMRTISYDLDTAEVYSDIYFIFPETLPGGEFSMAFTAGEVITPELTFSVLQPKGTTVLGEMFEVPRNSTP